MSGRVYHEDIVEALGQRYDFYSARNILQDALVAADMKPQESYSPEELSRIVWGLNQLGERAQVAVMALLELAGEAATADVEEEEEWEEDIPDEEAIRLVIEGIVAEALRRQVIKANQRKLQQEQPQSYESATEGEEEEDDDKLFWN